MAEHGKIKSYYGHEIVYRKMREQGILVWGQKGSGYVAKSCQPEINKFLNDVLSQPWAPKAGKVLELGCGTGPILRKICKRGFSGVGIDVSKTAIAMAKEQSKGLDIKYRQGDVCHINTKTLGKFDLVIDGLCLHCITDTKDRKTYLHNVFKMLKEGGLFVLLSMCGPMDRKLFAQVCQGYKVVGKTVYVPFDDRRYRDLTTFNGKRYLPSRYIDHWKNILNEVSGAGFDLNLIRYNTHNSKDFCGTLTVGALKNSTNI